MPVAFLYSLDDDIAPILLSRRQPSIRAITPNTRAGRQNGTGQHLAK
jgi:hypothetical protein